MFDELLFKKFEASQTVQELATIPETHPTPTPFPTLPNHVVSVSADADSLECEEALDLTCNESSDADLTLTPTLKLTPTHKRGTLPGPRPPYSPSLWTTETQKAVDELVKKALIKYKTQISNV